MSRRSVRHAAARLAPAPVLVLVLALAVAACGGTGGGIKVTEAWARNSPAVASAGAAYMVIENTGSAADALVGASSPVAKSTEVHETFSMGTEAPVGSDAAMGSAMPSGSDAPMGSAPTGGGMMGMRPVARVEIPAGGRLELKPGSFHIMLIGLNQELKAGDTFEITLRLEKAGEIKVTAEVRAG